ncbi:MAG: Rid family detoxifying hydrolase [Candidatus Eremiobacteraeota bacterium]|nr:Rid family detoxifying hydrolase [Candidatus Eremiobacteraeota bacterium]
MLPVSTADAPKPVAAYSQAVISQGIVYCSGQVGIDPQTGSLVSGIQAQAEQVFKNLTAVLRAAGTQPGNVLKANIFLADFTQFATVNAIYEHFVGTHRPARTTVGVAALPLGALIEVDVIAAKDDLTL